MRRGRIVSGSDKTAGTCQDVRGSATKFLADRLRHKYRTSLYVSRIRKLLRGLAECTTAPCFGTEEAQEMFSKGA